MKRHKANIKFWCLAISVISRFFFFCPTVFMFLLNVFISCTDSHSHIYKYFGFGLFAKLSALYQPTRCPLPLAVCVSDYLCAQNK